MASPAQLQAALLQRQSCLGGLRIRLPSPAQVPHPLPVLPARSEPLDDRQANPLMAVVSNHLPQMLPMAEQINLSVKQMPKEGNSVALLCPTMRAVLNGQDMLMHQHSRQKIGQWQVGRKRLSLTTKIEQNKTTLGLVLIDDEVETVLPGGPAFIAGLRKGDSIVAVSLCGMLC